jgi:hypothetical protein
MRTFYFLFIHYEQFPKGLILLDEHILFQHMPLSYRFDGTQEKKSLRLANVAQ